MVSLTAVLSLRCSLSKQTDINKGEEFLTKNKLRKYCRCLSTLSRPPAVPLGAIYRISGGYHWNLIEMVVEFGRFAARRKLNS